MIDRLERLVNLVIALRETRRPLPASEIHRRVAGYDQVTHESFRRTFERDKADLRAVGVPIETVATTAGEDVEGYRIDPRAYDLPAVELQPDELAAVALALEATGLADTAATGLRKLQVGAGAEPGTGVGAPVGWALELDDPNRAVLTEAQITRTRVSFEYRRPDGYAAARLVEPHGLVLRAGRWYLRGLDVDRGEVRNFRLDRIDGRVAARGRSGAYDLPDVPLDPEDVVPDGAESVTATVAATPEIAWQVARRASGEGVELPDGRTGYQVAGRVDDLVRWAIELGPEVEVQTPPELRSEIRARLTAVRDRHLSRRGATS